jgi:hypothetical protein
MKRRGRISLASGTSRDDGVATRQPCDTPELRFMNRFALTGRFDRRSRQRV